LCGTTWVTRNIDVTQNVYGKSAFGVFAHQTVPEGEAPRSYLERVYNIQRWTVFPRGGHFAPAEEPAAVAGDLAAFFRDLS
jgi:pimeloyl-ACP methyl ester carboxylesterase